MVWSVCGLEETAGLRTNGTAGTEKPVIAKILDEVGAGGERAHWTPMTVIMGDAGEKGVHGREDSSPSCQITRVANSH